MSNITDHNGQHLEEIGEPDIFTASSAYAARFAGAVGAFFLAVQAKIVMKLLGNIKGKKILEVGGAHGQLTPHLLGAGALVWVHASDEKSFKNMEPLQEEYPDQLQLITSSMFELPFEDEFFDFVIAIRLISHVLCWSALICEMCRLAKKSVIIDYPPIAGFNILYPILFKIKRKLEGSSTRTFLRFTSKEMLDTFSENGFKVTNEERQFFFPMALHRTLKCAPISKFLEGTARFLGLTKVFGAPIILNADRERSL